MTFFKEAEACLAERPDMTFNLCKYFRAIGTDRALVALLDFLSDPSRNLFEAQEQEVIDALLLMSVSLGPLRLRMTALALKKLSDGTVSPYSRALYSLLVYKSGESSDLEFVVDRYRFGVEKDVIAQRHFALAVTRLVDRDRMDDVVSRLLRDPDSVNRDIGLFAGSIRKRSWKDVCDLIKRTGLSEDVYRAPSTQSKVRRLQIRDLILLNLCRESSETRVRQLLRTRARAWRDAVECPVSQALLQELDSRL